MKAWCVLAIVVVCTLGPAVGWRKQKYSVKGRLFCGSDPAANVKVRLFDEDDGPDPDDKLDEGFTNTQGKFQLAGETRELTPIDPRLKIYHDCNDALPCYRKWRFALPNHMINKGVFDIGDWNLEIKQDDEDRKCNP